MLAIILVCGLITCCLLLIASAFFTAKIYLQIIEKTQALVFVKQKKLLDESEVTKKANLSNLYYTEQYNNQMLSHDAEKNQAEAESAEDEEDAWMYQGNRRSPLDVG